MHVDTIQEELLQEQFHAGDQQAFFTLVLLYYNDLFRCALKFTAEPELTKDLVNQFFIHLWDNRNNFSAAKKLQPYLLVTFKRFLLASYRTKQRETSLSAEEIELAELPYEEYIMSLQKEGTLKNAFYEAIKALPKRQKELVQLRFYEQLTYKQISETIFLSIRTIYNKINVALKNMRSNKLFQQLGKY